MTLFGLIADVALPVAVLLMAGVLAVITGWLARLDRELTAMKAASMGRKIADLYLTAPHGLTDEQLADWITEEES